MNMPVFFMFNPQLDQLRTMWGLLALALLTPTLTKNMYVINKNKNFQIDMKFDLQTTENWSYQIIHFSKHFLKGIF